MGFFSWRRCDDHKVITNRHSRKGALPVEMLDDKGNVWREDHYDGYGVFSGADYYEILDLMNGGEGDRGSGIELDFSGEPCKRPKFRRPGSKKAWDQLPDPVMAENQGYFY